jgi:ankyrin repeat protein
MALKLNDVELIQMLLERGAVVDGIMRATGETPLLFAVNKQATEAVRLLLEHGKYMDIR